LAALILAGGEEPKNPLRGNLGLYLLEGFEAELNRGVVEFLFISLFFFVYDMIIYDYRISGLEFVR